MNQTIAIDGEKYEVDRTVSDAINEALEEIEELTQRAKAARRVSRR